MVLHSGIHLHPTKQQGGDADVECTRIVWIPLDGGPDGLIPLPKPKGNALSDLL